MRERIREDGKYGHRKDANICEHFIARRTNAHLII